MNKYTLLTLMILSLSSCSDDELSWDYSDIAYFNCIWDKSPHNAFTDLIEYNNRYYCCFREGNAHVPSEKSEYGKIRILESLDGEKWDTFALIEDKDYDLRDPKLTVTPDNNLMVMYGCSSFSSDNTFHFRKTEGRIAYTTSESNPHLFSSINNISIKQGKEYLNNYWLWRITWHKGKAYGIAYSGWQPPILVSSNDGKNYEVITELKDLVRVNEADISFSSDDKMTVIIRSNGQNGYIGETSSPYAEWNWIILNHSIHCPKIISIENELFVSGRGESRNNTLYHVKKDKTLNRIYVFPGNGDSSYPGAIQVKDELWISYYTTTNRTAVYLVKIPVKKLFERAKIY